MRALLHKVRRLMSKKAGMGDNNMDNQSKMIYNSAYPEYAKGKYTSYLLLKFFPEEWQRHYFLSGKLYMRQHSEFAKAELGTGRSDCTEGSDFAVLPLYTNTFPDVRFRTDSHGGVYVEVTEYAEKPADYLGQPLFINRPAASNYRNIFSMYTLWFNKDNELLSEIDVDSMKNFGEYGVLICDTKTFFDRVAIAANTEKSISKMECGFVHYINGKNVMNLTPFIKRADGFSYQNEFRFCADTDNEELLELDTHTSFQDIAIPIRLQEFANTISLKNGLFYFQVDQSNEGNHANA